MLATRSRCVGDANPNAPRRVPNRFDIALSGEQGRNGNELEHRLRLALGTSTRAFDRLRVWSGPSGPGGSRVVLCSELQTGQREWKAIKTEGEGGELSVAAERAAARLCRELEWLLIERLQFGLELMLRGDEQPRRRTKTHVLA